MHRGRPLMMVFAPLLLAICVTSFLAVRGFRDQIDDERFYAHARDVVFQLVTVETALDAAEIDERTYLLSGDTTAYPSFAAELATIRFDVRQLDALTANDPVESRIAVRLRTTIAVRLEVLQHADMLRVAQRTVAAIVLMGSATSVQTMGTLHSQLAQMHAVASETTVAHRRTASTRVFEGIGPLVVLSVVNLVLLALLFLLIWHSLVAREAALRQQRETTAEAKAAIRMRDQFLSVAAHELRTPVTVLLPTVEFLERRLSPTLQSDERLRRDFATLHRQLKRLQTLISAMLDVSRIQRGQLTITREPVDLAKLVSTIVEEVQSVAPGRTIELRSPGEPIIVDGDAVRLSQVILNLLENAIKYSPSGGLIQVVIERTDAEVSVAFIDHGIGISADALAHLFERFYRAPPVRTEHIGGMGIGLYVVSDVVAQHDGWITVSSTEGVGSTFTVHLPLLAPAAPVADVAGEGEAPNERADTPSRERATPRPALWLSHSTVARGTSWPRAAEANARRWYSAGGWVGRRCADSRK